MTFDPANPPFRPGLRHGLESGSSKGSPSPEEDLAVRRAFIGYLTASLSDAAAESFELRLLEDDQFSRHIDLIEQDLLEEYAAGTLTHSLAQTLAADLPEVSTQGPVEAQIGAWIESSPKRREHVRLTRLLLDQQQARQLAQATAAQNKPQFRRRAQAWLWLGAVSAACLLLGSILWIRPMLTGTQLRHTHPATATIATASRPALAAPAPRRSADVILLAAERLRGPASRKSPTYTLHLDAPIRLQILLPGASAAEAYTVSVRRANSQTSLARFPLLPARQESGTFYLEATLAPGTLKPGAYVVTVSSPGAAVALPLLVRFSSRP